MPARTIGAWFWAPLPKPDARLTLLCLPHAGGDASGYVALARRLPAEVELWAVRLPGRGARHTETPIRGIDEMTRRLAQAVNDAVTGPYVVLGQSFGAAIGYELCRSQLLTHPPCGLVVASALPPSLWHRSHRPQTPEDLMEFLRRIGSDSLAVLEQPNLREYALRPLAADLAIQPGRGRTTPVDVPIHALSGTADPAVSSRDMAQWRGFSTRGFRLSMLEAGHFLMQSHADVAAATIRPSLHAWLGTVVPAGI